VRRGCPQGGVLSPLLSNMVADSLLNRLGNCNCSVQALADDVVILISEKSIRIIFDLMQRALNCVQNWCEEIGLSFKIRHLWYFSQKGGIWRETLSHVTDTEQSGKISGSHSR
jgi:hypothetical protein